MNEKKRVLDFIKQYGLMVIATVNVDGKPEAAVVEYGESDDLELIFDTYTSSRKYKNLQQNPSVACTIGWDENITIQYEGIATELRGEELQKFKDLYFAKNERARKWENREGITYFKITPKWIRYSDLNTDPWTIFEINF